MGSQFNWRGMPEMEPKMMQDGRVHPWRVQSNATSHQETQTQPDFDAAALMLLTDLQRLYLWASAQTDWDIHTSGEDTRFPLSASPFSGQGCSASLYSKAPLLSTHAQTHTHTGWLTRNDAYGRGAPQLDGLCRNWFGILPLQCQKVTLRPVPDSASTPSRCAQRGGAPRHRRASGGMAQRLPFNGGQNQAAKKRERGNTSVSKSTWALLWLW